MPITMQDVEKALNQEPEEAPGGYTDRESILYAVAIGMGRDPLDPKELEYVCETIGNRVVPTAATVLSSTNQPAALTADSLFSKMNFALMLHGEQRLQIHRPLPPAANTIITNRTTGAITTGLSYIDCIITTFCFCNKRPLNLSPCLKEQKNLTFQWS